MDEVYHLTFSDDTEVIKVVCIGIDCVDTQLDTVYNNVSLMPKWARGRIAVIGMLQKLQFVEGVGGRTTENQYWIVPERD